MSEFRIAVIDKGFVYVGEIVRTSEGWLLSGAKNLRVWGTTKGLGELALHGPTKSTVQDEVGEVFVPTHSMVHIISTDANKWK